MITASSATLEFPQVAAASGTRGRGAKPRLGFLGVGWIGRHRMQAIAKSALAEIVAICDPSAAQAQEASRMVPGAEIVGSLAELLSAKLDGLVIATPSALHAEQAEQALESGAAVFCQKPLGRDGRETARVIAAAKSADRLLGVDLSYRYLAGARKVRELCAAGALGRIYAADLVFHNAYGPDKPWFYNPALSGGGCLIDLGIHLVDLALWNLDFPPVTGASGRLFCKGAPLADRATEAEDYVEARLDTAIGVCLRFTCSWNLQAGREAVISAAFYGTEGGAAIHNLNGSFYEFTASRFIGTKTETLSSGPEEWGGLAILDWTQKLGLGAGFDPEIESLATVASSLDMIYESRVPVRTQ